MFGKRIKLSFFCQVKDNSQNRGTKGEEEEQAASGMQNLKNQTLPRTHRKSKRKLARLLSVCLSLGVCVCAPKNFCHELRLGKMCEKNISKQSKSDARAIENFSHRLAEGKSQKKVDKKNSEGGGEGNPRKIIIENANASMHLSLSGRGRQTGRRTKSKPKRKSSKCQLPNDILLLPRPLSSPVPLHLSLSLTALC